MSSSKNNLSMFKSRHSGLRNYRFGNCNDNLSRCLFRRSFLFEHFLYAIGSVFAPLFAILLTDYFLLINKQIQTDLLINWVTLALCALGTMLYYQFIKLDFVMGATIPVMIIISILHVMTGRLTARWKYVKKSLQA